jgi:benzoate-CoA ligase
VVGRARDGVINYEDLVSDASPELQAEETSKDDVAFWLYSSGTTGRSKGVVHLQHDMIYSAELYGRHVLEMNEDDKVFSISRLFFAYGLGGTFNFPFHVGASTILSPERPLPDKVFEIIDKYKPSILFGVPTSYNAMLQIGDAAKKYDLDSLRLCVSAGEALPRAVFEQWKRRFGIEILDGIGSTEALHIFCSNARGQLRPGSSGRPVPGYELKIVDNEGMEVPQGEGGSLMVKGESNFAYYWNKHQKTRETIVGEWICTGDKYYQDEDGYYWYMGRSDDMIKVGGIWVSPTEVENALLEHPSVFEAAVIGVADRDQLVKPKAFIVLKAGYDPSSELASEIQNSTKTQIAPYKYPRWIQFVAELPKTSTGKIQRFKIRHDESINEFENR